MLKLGYLYKDLYEMTINELEDTLKYRKEGMGYVMWRNGIVTSTSIASCFSKNVRYPKKPQLMLEELYEKPKGIPMPDFLKKKYYERR